MSRGGVLLFSLLALLCILSLPGSSPTEPLQEAGAGPDSGEHLSPHEAQPPSAGSPRADTSRNWMVRFVLLPMTLFFLLILCWGLRGSSKTPGLKLAAALSLLMGAAAVWTVLPAPASVALLRDVNFRDGVDSMEIIASIHQSLPGLTDVSQHHSYPDGASWITTVGPGWLGYLPAALIAVFAGPVAAHNLGVGFHIALLALAAWALARTVGVGPIVSLLAAAGAAFAPHVLSELDSSSIDRSAYYLVPLFFLCLHRTGMDGGGRRWPVLGGVALAAVFYGQTYYGLYLAAACPLLLIPRLASRRGISHLGRYALLGGVALAVLAPGLLVLDRSTSGTAYERPTTSMGDAFSGKLLSPIDMERAQAEIRASGSMRESMTSPRERLISAISRSMPLEWVLFPMYMLSGNAAYWGLVLLAILLARNRSRALLAAYDVAVLLLLAMGPFARTLTSVSSVPLPYYAYMLHVPGFENLKSLGRFMLLAATIAPVPLAMGLQGALDRLGQRRGEGLPAWARGLAVTGCVLLLCFFHLPAWLLDIGSPLGPRRPSESDSPLVSYPGPVVTRLPLPRALAGLPAAPALLLPMRRPSPVPMRILPLQAGLYTVNEPGHGAARPSRLETNAFIQRAHHLTGFGRKGQLMPPGDATLPLAELRQAGVRYVVVFLEEMPGADAVERTRQFLDRHLERVADDGEVAVWKISPGTS